MMRLRVGSLGVVAAAVATVLLAVSSQPATADIVKDTGTSSLAQGFGNVPRLLTDQRTGGVTSPETACNSIGAGGVLVQTCSGKDATISPNGFIDNLANGDGTVQPANDSAKNNIVNLSDPTINITNASQIRILYNPSETGGSPTTDIQDLTLKFYNAAGVVVASVDGGCGNACNNNSTDPLFFGDTGTNLGNGGVGFVLKLTDAQAAALNLACGANMANCQRVTAEATILLTDDGPDSFTLFSSALTSPEPSSLLLLGISLVGVRFFTGRRRP